jgi:predicted RNA methylase
MSHSVVSTSSWDAFDVAEYVRRCYGDSIMDVDRALIEGVIDAMQALDLKPGSWRRAADVGAGPNLFPSLLMAPFMVDPKVGGQLDLIEIGASNRDYLKTVTTASPCPAGLDTVWTKFEELMADRSELWVDSLQKVRALATVRAGDIFALPPETYDAISAFFVPESITDSFEQCELAVAKLIAAAKPDGFIMVGHMLGSDGWYAGEGNHYPAVPLSIEQLSDLYEDHLDFMRIIEPPLTPEVRHGYNGAAVVVGKKKRELSRAERVFTPYDIQNCLYDRERVEYFKRAIDEKVQLGDVVVDGGSGTGVLGLLAAQAGAKTVYCIELSPEYARVIEENARINGLSDRIRVIKGDAAAVRLPEQVDVIISEVISGGLFYEPQLQIVGNLRRFLRDGGSVIPQAMTNYVELIQAQDHLYGLKFSYDTRHRILDDHALTDPVEYLNVAFAEDTPLLVDATVCVRAKETGLANALRVPYSLQFSDTVFGDRPTEFLLNPQTIFLPAPVLLEAGCEYSISMRYHSGDSPLNAIIKVTEVPAR